ncbi:hypothetical protein AB1Y20_013824 [Prymnesium parvum]|uniref:Tyr recombinase domain-containing protein n=1 Tax=Prymnesium parvum TaxID=97485 RepID=A0AB34IGW6_PRYPA
MRRGRHSPREPPDQWGEIHCPYPVILTFYVECGNAAAALRDLELSKLSRFPNVPRAELPLIHDERGQPFTHAFMAGLLRDVLTHCFGPNVARLCTWHSYRSGLATALHAAGVDDGMIMLICRWMSPESLHVYRRMGTAENERHTRRAMAANVDLIQATNVPKVMGDQGYAELFSAYRTLAAPSEWTVAAGAHAAATTATSPATQPQQVTSPPAAAANGFAAASDQTAHDPHTPPRSRRPHRPPVVCEDAGSTTGVGRLRHKFPPTLQQYTVYNDRPSSRRAPTARSRAQWEIARRGRQQG